MSSVRSKVEGRAKNRCEYCRAPQAICAYTFNIEHIIPRAKGGANTLFNYALACFPCNNAKSDHVAGVDPDSREEVALFHPRRQKWTDHFSPSRDYSRIEGLTVTGRATVDRLKMNERLQSRARLLWVSAGLWP